MKPVNETAQNPAPRVVAVVVLYRLLAQESATLRTLACAFDDSQELRHAIDVVVWDNTPGERQAPAGIETRFWHDPANPGLAAAYNRGLEHAKECGAQWLVTFDQDTHVTPEYLRELLHASQQSTAAALLPRLTADGRVLSPFRPRTQGPPLPLEDALVGETAEYLQAFNSGAALSVPFLSQIGGFDSNFPLDYLDHVTFARLHRSGRHVHVLRSRLEHELSSQAPGHLSPAALKREQNVLAAERRFVQACGTPDEQCMYPVRMLRRTASVLAHRGDAALALLILRTLFGANR